MPALPAPAAKLLNRTQQITRKRFGFVEGEERVPGPGGR
jgi:hypothetical protein